MNNPKIMVPAVFMLTGLGDGPLLASRAAPQRRVRGSYTGREIGSVRPSDQVRVPIWVPT
jgi:hypothetical protein